MKFKDLVGETIRDITVKVGDFDYNGSIALEESKSSVLLASKKIIEFPPKEMKAFYSCMEPDKSQKSIFKAFKFPFFLSARAKLIHRNTKNIQNKKIVAVYFYDSNNSESGRQWDHYIVEVESGFLISEVKLSPKGTGTAGIWVFSSKKDFEKRIGSGLKKVI